MFYDLQMARNLVFECLLFLFVSLVCAVYTVKNVSSIAKVGLLCCRMKMKK